MSGSSGKKQSGGWKLLSQKEWQDIFKDTYQGDVKFDIPMKDYTSVSIGGSADLLLVPDDPLSLRNLVVVLKKKDVPFLPFGGGTNVIIRDSGIEGAVISIKAFKRIEVLKEGNRYADLFVEGGVSLQKLVNFCKGKGYSGTEGLAGIPGTVGGAICGNAGSFGYEIKDVITSVAIMDSDGRLDRFKAEGLGFGYRRSDISHRDIVLSANMRFKRDEIEEVSARTEEFLAEKRQKQPISERTAGCVFKNPGGESAGKIIDEAGCKGMRIGGVEVSTVHANFFINRGGGTASDYLNLMDEVSSMVNKRFGITLEPEIRVVGRS